MSGAVAAFEASIVQQVPLVLLVGDRPHLLVEGKLNSCVLQHPGRRNCLIRTIRTLSRC